MSTNTTGQASLNLWQHNALASDLARHLSNEGRMVWLDMQLGPQGSPRPDVYRIDKSFVRPCPTAYECKISRSDFLSDVTTGKWRSYLNYAYSVIFAVPEGLVKPSELPDMCGLIVRKDSGWRIAKRATVNPHPIAEHALLKLLIDGVEREGPGRRRQLYVEQYAGDRFAKKFGYEAARFVADAASIHTRLETAARQAAQIIERAHADAKADRDRKDMAASKLWQQLVESLDLREDADLYAVRDAIRQIRVTADGVYKTALETIANSMRGHVSQIDRMIQHHEATRKHLANVEEGKP